MTELQLITFRGLVYPWHCDHMGHMNVQHYVGRFDQATWQMFAMIGITPAYMRDHHCGVAAVRQNISYRCELLPGDPITVRTGILEINQKIIRFYHEMIKDETGEISATTLITGIHMDTQTRRASPFPEDVVAGASRMIVEITPIL